MSLDEPENLMRSCAGRRVVVDARRPELTRFGNRRGRVVAVTCDGRALVQFDGPDQGWYDIEPEFLKPEPPS
jgi:hypothetical protein